ncbi:unnamed protein product [Pylaiella littoralis]
MREAQSALGKEQQRALAFENRALHSEGLLLQQNRMRIREAARARARSLELEVENIRRNERIASKKERSRMESEAATRVQRAATGYLQRRRFQAELLSIRALQRGVRSMLVARRKHQHRVCRSLAALLLQGIWRGRSARKRLEIREARVTIVQAILRGHLQRTRVSEELRAHRRLRYEAATVLQNNRRRFVSRQAYLSLRLASLKVQSNHRRFCARRKFESRTPSAKRIPIDGADQALSTPKAEDPSSSGSYSTGRQGLDGSKDSPGEA